MIYVTHDGDNRRTWNQCFCFILFFFLLHFIGIFNTNEFYFNTKFAGNQFNYFRIQTLINGYHYPQVHTLANYIGKANIHQVGQFTHCYKFCNL